MCSKDLKGSLIILQTFIASGKTVALAELLSSIIRDGETAVFMTPCPSEVLNFLKGMYAQIKDLVRSDVFKTLLAKDPFKIMFQELFERLSTINIFESHLSLGQDLVAGSTNIFVLEPKHSHIIWVYGNPRFKMLILDDVRNSAEIAEIVLSNNPNC